MRKREMALYTLILFVLLAAIAGVIHDILIPRVTVEEVRQAIRLGLSPGASRAAVRTWLASQSYIQYNAEIADKKTGSIRGFEAEIRNTGPRWETPQRIRIIFFFDCDKLSRFEITKDQTPYVFP